MSLRAQPRVDTLGQVLTTVAQILNHSVAVRRAEIRRWSAVALGLLAGASAVLVVLGVAVVFGVGSSVGWALAVLGAIALTAAGVLLLRRRALLTAAERLREIDYYDERREDFAAQAERELATARRQPEWRRLEAMDAVSSLLTADADQSRFVDVWPVLRDLPRIQALAIELLGGHDQVPYLRVDVRSTLLWMAAGALLFLLCVMGVLLAATLLLFA